MIMQGMPYDAGLFTGFIFMLGITMVAAPGIVPERADRGRALAAGVDQVLGQHVRRTPQTHCPALVQDQHLVAERGGQVQVVQGDNHSLDRKSVV